MLRQSDLELVVLAFVAGGVVVGLVSWRRDRLGPLAVTAALAFAWWGDRALLDAVPHDAIATADPWVAFLAVAGAVGWGASRLPVTPVVRGLPPVLPLALGSLVGVWAGVPETSVALLTGGVLVGMATVMGARQVTLSPWGAIVMAVTPVGAAYIGAVGNAHALLGGALCSATLVVLGTGPTLRRVSASALASGSAVHLVSALMAARLIAVRREWSTAPFGIALVVGLAVLAARILRSGQVDEPE